MNFDEIFKKEVEIAESAFMNGVDGRKVMSICRANYDLWMTCLFPIWTAQGINCHRKVAEIFQREGYNASEKVIGTYIARLHKENNTNKKKARGYKGKSAGSALPGQPGAVTAQAENFNLSSTAGAVAMVDEVTQPGHEKDWLDPEWIGDEPDWNAIRAKTFEPVPGEWSDSWENVWRHLYKRANEHGLNEEMKKSYAGFKSMGDDIGGLWLALNKTRRQLKGEYGWNPVGVGKAV